MGLNCIIWIMIILIMQSTLASSAVRSPRRFGMPLAH
jgi:hypothetical protein